MPTALETEVEIAASSEKVWAVLTDFSSYREWNPFIKSIAGPLEEGAKLDVTLQPPGSRSITLHPKILSVVPGKELKWLGHLGMPGIFDGEHRFLIQDGGPGRLRFVQGEAFKGLLVPFTRKLLESTKRGFEEMNTALKDRAETVS